MNSYDLTGRVAIVTGAGQGIGLTVAERMLESGASVSVWDIDQKLLDALDARHGKSGKLQVVNGNIGKLDSVEAATKAVLDRFGKIDVLVNNAAIVGPNANTWEYPPQAFMDVVHIGLVGTFFVCRTVVPHMIAQNYGRIVNLADMQPMTESTHCSQEPVRYVLEMNQGWFAKKNIKKGAKLGGELFAAGKR